jgi:hypothetical protein
MQYMVRGVYESSTHIKVIKTKVFLTNHNLVYKSVNKLFGQDFHYKSNVHTFQCNII